MNRSLLPFSIFAAVLATAGLPIYIHAPKFYVDAYGVGLAGLGAVLFGLRLLDVVQDPLLGWLSRRLGANRPYAVATASTLMALAMLGLFAATPPVGDGRFNGSTQRVKLPWAWLSRTSPAKRPMLPPMQSTPALPPGFATCANVSPTRK